MKAAKTCLMRLWTVEALAEYVSVAGEVIVKVETAENWCLEPYTGSLYSVRKPPSGFYSFLSCCVGIVVERSLVQCCVGDQTELA